MGYARALLQRDVRREETDIQKKAAKKSLWGSIGRTVGGLGAMALTGGLVNPLTLGLITGGATFLGGAIGAKASGTGDLKKGGQFFKSDRAELQKELGAFGTQNITSSLKSGVTAGIGQKLKLAKLGKEGIEGAKLSEGFGMDFKGSMLGKGLEKRKAANELATMRGWQGQYEALQLDKPSAIMKGDVPSFGSFTDPGQYAREGSYISEPIQESLYGGVDPNPRGTNLLETVQGFGSGSKRGFQF